MKNVNIAPTTAHTATKPTTEVVPPKLISAIKQLRDINHFFYNYSDEKEKEGIREIMTDELLKIEVDISDIVSQIGNIIGYEVADKIFFVKRA